MSDADKAEVIIGHRRCEVSMLNGEIVVGGLLTRTIHRVVTTGIDTETVPGATVEVEVGR